MPRQHATFDEILLALRKTMFNRLPDEDPHRLAQQSAIHTLKAGAKLFHQGDAGSIMVVLLDGHVLTETCDHRVPRACAMARQIHAVSQIAVRKSALIGAAAAALQAAVALAAAGWVWQVIRL